MKPSLQLSLGQHLNLTPQLQQAIRLLQLSTLDLQQEVQQILESNPLLEVEKKENQEQDKEVDKKQQENDFSEKLEASNDTQVDTAWEDVYATQTSRSSHDESVNYENLYASSVNLQDHLRWQMDLTPMTVTDHTIGTAIIDAVDDTGFLSVTLEDIVVAANLQLNLEDPIEVSEVKAVLHLIQRFDPLGVAALDLRDCLLVQLSQIAANEPYLKEAKNLVSDHLDWLGTHNYTQIMRHCKYTEEQLQGAIKLIQSLTPYPGETILKEDPSYIVPDVIVTNKNGRWKVELNADAMPKLRVNQTYANLIHNNKNAQDTKYLKTQLQEAKWFIKSLQSRHDTLLRVTTSIVKKQMGFLEHGEEAMKPMVLNDIADELGLHESTISRVTTQKFVHTPRGVFELKYFFSSHVATAAGGECSSTAIQAVIKKLIAAENPKKPLSDNKIAHILKERGIQVARRTIAKYREALHIPASNLRKGL